MKTALSARTRNRVLARAEHLGTRYATAEVCYFARELDQIHDPGHKTFLALRSFHRAERLGDKFALVLLALSEMGMDRIARRILKGSARQASTGRAWFVWAEREAGRPVPEIPYAFDPNETL